jgi:hypothetical protein
VTLDLFVAVALDGSGLGALELGGHTAVSPVQSTFREHSVNIR